MDGQEASEKQPKSRVDSRWRAEERRKWRPPHGGVETEGDDVYHVCDPSDPFDLWGALDGEKEAAR